MKRSRLVTLARRVLVLVTLALWCAEGLEDATDPQWLSPALDNFIDCLMVTLSIGLIVWWVHSYFARIHAEVSRREHVRDRKVAAVFDAMGTACQAAGVPVPDGADTQPHPCVRLVSEKRETG
jgi:hypothetical protein